MAGTAVNDQVDRVFAARSNRIRIVQGLRIAWKNQGRRHDGFTQLGQECGDHRMIGNPHSYGASFRMLQALGNLSTGRKKESETARDALTDGSELPVVEVRIATHFCEITA